MPRPAPLSFTLPDTALTFTKQAAGKGSKELWVNPESGASFSKRTGYTLYGQPLAKRWHETGPGAVGVEPYQVYPEPRTPDAPGDELQGGTPLRALVAKAGAMFEENERVQLAVLARFSTYRVGKLSTEYQWVSQITRASSILREARTHKSIETYVRAVFGSDVISVHGLGLRSAE